MSSLVGCPGLSLKSSGLYSICFMVCGRLLRALPLGARDRLLTRPNAFGLFMSSPDSRLAPPPSHKLQGAQHLFLLFGPRPNLCTTKIAIKYFAIQHRLATSLPLPPPNRAPPCPSVFTTNSFIPQQRSLPSPYPKV